MERPYKRLIKHPNFEIPVPDRVSIIGFLITVAIAASMVLGLLLLVDWLGGG